MSRIWVTGYRNYEMGIFNDSDKKLEVIKRTLKSELSRQIENGCDWIITGGQLGAETWTNEVAVDLRKKYPNEFKLALMMPFQHFGSNWNEVNQAKLARNKINADFVKAVSEEEYHSPNQLKNYQQFMLSHTDGAVFLYDPDYEGKTKYDFTEVSAYKKQHAYPLTLIDMDQLQDSANEMEQEINDDF